MAIAQEHRFRVPLRFHVPLWQLYGNCFVKFLFFLIVTEKKKVTNQDSFQMTYIWWEHQVVSYSQTRKPLL